MTACADLCVDMIVPQKTDEMTCEEYASLMTCASEFAPGHVLRNYCCDTCDGHEGPVCEDNIDLFRRVHKDDEAKGINTCADFAAAGFCFKVKEPGMGYEWSDYCCETCDSLPADTTCLG